jgi:selenoprotein W-related protein
LTDELLRALESSIESLALVPSSGGVFEVEVNGSLIYSKKTTGRHAGSGEVFNLVQGLASGGETAAASD